MKKQINALKFLTLAGFLMIALCSNANNAQCESKLNEVVEYFNSFTYSWSEEPSAESYTLEIVNTDTQEVFSWTTTDSSVSAFGIPQGAYSLKLIGHPTSGASFIITEDTIIH